MPNWRYPQFDWDDGNVEYIIDRHGVFPEEAEQVFFNRPHIRRVGEVYQIHGRDNRGRYLFLVCIERDHKIRVVSAREQTAKERRVYERQN
jgi:hypothetical protein